MSSASQRSTRTVRTPSSILKKPRSIKSRLSELHSTPIKVRFVLPHSQKVNSILEGYIQSKVSRDYENLVCLLRDAELTDDDVSSILTEATECISILNQNLRLFVEALLSIPWTDKSPKVVSEYQSFIVNLLSAHNYHAKMVVDKLVKLFLPDPTEPDWPEGTPSKKDQNKFVNIHALIKLLLNVIPMCREILMSSVTSQFPYYNKSTHMHEYYVHNLLCILEYQPCFRPDILSLLFSKLIIMDVNAPREEIEKFLNADEEMFSMDDDAKSVKTSTTAFTQVDRHALSHALDICLEKVFNYFKSKCYDSNSGEPNWEQTKKLYHDMIVIFEKIILPTYDTHHVQFIMFLLCSYNIAVTEAFLNFLWKKVCNPNVAPVLRQASVNYIASLLARANFIPLTMVKGTLQQLAEWIHSYISTQDGLECVNSDLRVHQVFYSVCQALFYIVSFRHKDLVKSKKSIVFLESLNMAKMVTSRLNPLRVCQPAVVQNFAAITRKYQLAYCYTVIDHNSRNVLPTIYQSANGTVVMSNNILDGYYPFDPFVLERSGKKIHPSYRDYEETESNRETEQSDAAEVDDFLFGHEVSSPPKSRSHKFSYGSSPGFKFKI
ncbi:RNA polymerase I-specific transcription initiation factor RRN3 homolog Tif-IA [Leptinotarsa decemlineata]|uniref:RNA polymerase I-specific transcription initiation factor RRN3 homolog Tif-IA n=1 Tax=Leptinotarsa decemlineata TaxID=7539 RepID=UPI003D30C62F